MLSFFRNNQVSTAAPLALYVLLTHAGALFGYILQGDDASQGGLLYDALLAAWLHHSILSPWLAALLVFIIALLVNNLADEFRILNDRNWLPGMAFVLISAGSTEFLFLSPPLVACFFIPVALRRIIKVYKAVFFVDLVFDSAFWLMVGNLFYPASFLLLLAGLAGLNSIRALGAKNQIVFLTGVLVPWMLCWLGFFWFDQGNAFVFRQLGAIGQLNSWPPMENAPLWSFVLICFYLGIAVLGFGRFYSRKLIHQQKSITVLYWFLIFGVIAFFFAQNGYLPHFLLIIPSLAIFLAMLFMGIRSQLLAEFFHLILLLGMFSIQFYPLISALFSTKIQIFN